MHKRDIICIGASAGGVEALLKITAQLPVDFPAAIFVVIHVPATPPSMLHEILSRPGKIAVLQAEDGLAIQNARIYIAQSDHHLLIEKRVYARGAWAKGKPFSSGDRPVVPFCSNSVWAASCWDRSDRTAR